MKRFAILAIALICGAAQAQTIKLAPGTWYGTGKVVITVDAAGKMAVTLDPSGTVTIDGTTPGPGPNPVPVPIGDLSATVKAATAAVPAYADKDGHRRAMAFGMSFLAQATANAPVDKSRATVKQFCNAACGADAVKWTAWWATVDAKLDSAALTPATYTAALGEMAAALTDGLPPGASDSPKDFHGSPTYGLSPELIKFLIEVLLPLLIKLLTGGG